MTARPPECIYLTCLQKIHIYDINSGKWYNQTASGEVSKSKYSLVVLCTFCRELLPTDILSRLYRLLFRPVASRLSLLCMRLQAFDRYIYGGYGFGNPAAFDDVYILSLPSFKWVKGYPLGGDSNQFGHGGCSATVMNPDQMMVIGGWFPNTSFVDCDASSAQGQHNMILGGNTGKEENSLWDKYDPNLSAYVVPSMVIAAIGGGSTGGATVTSPSTWDHPDLKVYTGSPNWNTSGKKNIGAIAGGVVGGLAVLIIVLSLILLCLHRRKKAKNEKPEAAPVIAPAELDVGRYPHEMSTTTTASKYVAVHEHADAHDQYNYQTSTSHHPQASNYNHNLPPDDTAQSYPSTSPHATRQHSSQHSTYSHPSQSRLRSPRNEELFFANEQAVHNGQDEQWSQQPSRPSRQRQHSYSTPMSPQRPTNETTQQQVYYPPPQDSLRHPQPSHHPPPPDQRGSPTSTQYSGETQHGYTPNVSTTNTPAHFYAQNLPRRGPSSGETGEYR
jgi:hypothetical protein